MKKEKTNTRIEKITETFRDRIEDARIRLALLKEKASYRKFYQESATKALATYRTREDLKKCYPNGSPHSRRKGSAYWKTVADAQKTIQTFRERCMKEFGMQRRAFPGAAFSRSPVDGFFALLDPSKEISEVSAEDQGDILPHLFFAPAIRGIAIPGHSHEHPRTTRISLLMHRRIEPFERLLLVDLRRKKGQLEREFRAFLEAVETSIDVTPEKHATWRADRTRMREETWQHLSVWKMRRMRKGFGEIARTGGITLGAAKMSFYRAHELIEDRPYDREKYKLEHWRLRACGSCDDHPSRGGKCNELCPDMEAQVGGVATQEIPHENIQEIEAKRLYKEWLNSEAREIQSKENDGQGT